LKTRDTGWRLAVLLFCVLFLGPVAGAAEPAAPRPPNIVLIISDDQAWTDYSFMGHEHVRTPNLDRLAAQSLTFKRGYVPASLCCPSLASVITGLYPHQHKVTSNDPPTPKGTKKGDPAYVTAFEAGRDKMNGFMEAVPTLPRILGERGYVSFQAGKWWQGEFRHGGFTHGMTTKGSRHGDEGLTIGRQTMQPVFDFMDTAKREGKPFLVWYAPMMPHTPHTPPKRLMDKYRQGAPSVHVGRYWAMCEWFDETVGALLGELDRRGIANDTIVIYMADNGWIQNPDKPGFAPRSKQSPYEGGIRTPIMIRWPARVKPEMSESLASSIDLAPTLLKAVGTEPASAMPGINLLDEAAVKGRSTLFGECFTHDAVDLQRPASSLRWRWAIDGNWKLIAPDAKNEPGGKPELYDLSNDPHEKTNLTEKDPQRVTAMLGQLNGWWDPTK
jgi:arylsulfatase A-like enzyme